MYDAKNQAKAQVESIVELVNALNVDWDRLHELREIDSSSNDSSTWYEYESLETPTSHEFDSREEVEQAIQEKPLSVEVRSGWESSFHSFTVDEFRIVLCTGGPHVEIRGDIGLHGEPQDVKVFYADWSEKGEYVLSDEEREAVTEFCQQFYFGE